MSPQRCVGCYEGEKRAISLPVDNPAPAHAPTKLSQHTNVDLAFVYRQRKKLVESGKSVGHKTLNQSVCTNRALDGKYHVVYRAYT